MNNPVPLWSPRFRTNETTLDLEYKPFPRYPTWLLAWSMSPIVDAFAAYDALLADINTLLTEHGAILVTLTSDVATAQATADAAQATADAAQADAAVLHERRATMFHDESVCTFGTPTLTVTTAQRYNYYRWSATQGNAFKNSFVMDLSLGATLYLLGATSNGSGICDIYIDGVFLASIDFYTAGNVFNVEKTATIPASVHGAGKHKIEMLAPTKHASSSGYAIVLTKLYVIRSDGD